MIVQRKNYLPGNYIFFIVCILLPLLSSCGAKNDPPPPFDYKEGAVTLHYQATEQLNSVDGKSHSLLLVIYQLNDPNAFNRFAGYKEGLQKLLEANLFDPSVTALKKQYIEPGGARTLSMDRAEKTKHIGIVAGYYDLVPSKCTVLIDVSYDTKRRGLFKIWKTTEVEDLTIKIALDENSLRLEKEKDDT